MGREWGGGGQFTSNLGQDRTTQKEGFQVSKGGIRRGYQQGVAPSLNNANLYIRIISLYECN
jgi:hypothetical protein